MTTALAVKEKSIPFLPEMIRAIQAGIKDTTRRLIKFDELGNRRPCKYQVGDVLWVKEALINVEGLVTYQTDNEPVIKDHNGLGFQPAWPWRVSRLGAMYMPRWASRITLEVVNVRVERLQDITRADIDREGTPAYIPDGQQSYTNDGYQRLKDWEHLWDGINTKPGTTWQDNPWVWVVEFERVK